MNIPRTASALLIGSSLLFPITTLALPCPDAEVGPISQALSKGTAGSGSSAPTAGGSTAALQATIEGEAKSLQGDFPNLNVRIPGLRFSNFLQTGVSERGTQTLSVPYLAQYVSAIYQYLVGIATIIAAIMIIYGGLQYLLGETITSVSSGKKIIEDALIGLVLLFSSVLILRIVGVEGGLKPLTVDLIRRDPFSYMGANSQAPATLAEVGIVPREKAPDPASIANTTQKTGTPDAIEPRPTGGSAANNEYIPPKSTAQFPTDLTIPIECPGRDKNFDAKSVKTWPGSSRKFNPATYTLCSKFGCISGKSIEKYLEEQSRSGVPAAVLMAQIFTEAGPCPGVELFQNPEKCGALHYNFGGVGCTDKQVPPGHCPNTAFGKGYVIRGGPPAEFTTKHPKSGAAVVNGDCNQTVGMANGFGPNKHNRGAAADRNLCPSVCEQYKTPEALAAVPDYCGKNCFPILSQADVTSEGSSIRYYSVQCSRKFNSPEEFLGTHLGFVKACLPFNDSVYKFAYCIGASTYAGSTGDKATVLAEIIERNCLCGSKDSSGCKRDLELEAKLNKSIIKKTNFFKTPPKCLDCDAKGKCIKRAPYSEPDYDTIVKELMKNSGLKPNAEYYPHQIDPPLTPVE